MNRIDAFLELAAQQGGSDLHLVSGEPPRIRLLGRLEPVRFRELSPSEVMSLIDEMIPQEMRPRLDDGHMLDFAYTADKAGRFRVNVSRHLRGVAAVMRLVPSKVPEFASLGMPDAVRQVLMVPKGLTLVTGPTGSGKSTTLAAMVDFINQTRKGHIVTIEDPIEFVHEYKSCVITQREIGAHAPTFAEALKSCVREDPDAILIGEMRDLETISLALTAAETGIQVLGTLHTNGSVRSVDRIVNVFPGPRQAQVRTMLADSLRMVVSQQLVRRADQTGRVVAAEVLINTHAVSSMIRRGESHKLMSAIQAGSRHGMQGLDSVLTEMVRAGTISGEEAYEHALDRSQFERYASGQAA